MSGEAANDPGLQMKIGACADYGDHLFDLLREGQKSSSPGCIFVSRIRASAHDLLIREEDIKKEISSFISQEKEEELMKLLLEIEKTTRSISKSEMPKRPFYLNLMVLLHRK